VLYLSRPSDLWVSLVQISISLNKDEPETPLTDLMKKLGVEKIREVLGSYVGFLKTGEWTRTQFWFWFSQSKIL